ncbi:PREDICTED: uncharacterized protein C16orf96 homolog [Calidris pugnax]|uniref:uncharacterized protein C16orf96 homolog n=1 Tax=Calidris pugnax TaxID=198806 RepID=UPI00071C2573|nr:PREDICTED: uncharacterized protein C16orf96 homolog [Calidris pugnax]
MSVTVTLAELADLAFGMANGGNPQVGAFRILLRGLLEHLCPQEAVAQVGENERSPSEPTARVARGKPSSLHQQRQLWQGRAEGQPSRPSRPLGTAELPALGRQAAEEWQMVQLKKRMEVTEEGMAKVMDMLQEMLTTTCSLKTTVEGFQDELQLLKDRFQKADLEELQEQSVKQDENSHLLQSILDQLTEVRQQLSAFPWHGTTLCQRSFCEVAAGEKLSSQELSPEPLQEPSHEAPCKLSWLMEQHEVVSHCESQLQQYSDLGTLEDTAAQLEKGPTCPPQGLDFGREVLDQVGQLKEQCARLQEAAERLWGDIGDTQKADKAALETKLSQDELQHAMVQLSQMMQNLLQRMSLLDQDRQKDLEKLLSEMDSKAKLEQIWRLTQRCLCKGRCCGANRAAGFKRQLFDPVKCLSCNRPLDTAPAPPLVTVRKASQILRPQPASAGRSNCLAQPLPGRESEGSSRGSRGSPTSPHGPPSTSSSLITVCPCGDTADFTCKNREVDILGVNGVVYKGRLSSLAANRTVTVGKDPPGRGAAPGHSSSQAAHPPQPVPPAHPKATKTPQPHSRHTLEMRRALKYGTHYVSPYSCECQPCLSPPLWGHRPHHSGSAQGASCPCARLFVLLHCRCCQADEDSSSGG